MPNEVSPDIIQTLRAKFPQYHDLSDQALAQAILRRYPQYGDLLGPIAQGRPAPAKPAPKPGLLQQAGNVAGAIGQGMGAVDTFIKEHTSIPALRQRAPMLPGGQTFVGAGGTTQTQHPTDPTVLFPNPIEAPAVAAGRIAARPLEQAAPTEGARALPKPTLVTPPPQGPTAPRALPAPQPQRLLLPPTRITPPPGAPEGYTGEQLGARSTTVPSTPIELRARPGAAPRPPAPYRVVPKGPETAEDAARVQAVERSSAARAGRRASTRRAAAQKAAKAEANLRAAARKGARTPTAPTSPTVQATAAARAAAGERAQQAMLDGVRTEAAVQDAQSAAREAAHAANEDVSGVVEGTSATRPTTTSGGRLYRPIAGGAAEAPRMPQVGFWGQVGRAGRELVSGDLLGFRDRVAKMGWQDVSAALDRLVTMHDQRLGHDLLALTRAGLHKLSDSQWAAYLAWKRYGTISKDAAVARFFSESERIFGEHQSAFRRLGSIVLKREWDAEKGRVVSHYVPFADAQVERYTPEYFSPTNALRYSQEQISAALQAENRGMAKDVADQIAGWLHQRARGEFSDIPLDQLRRWAMQQQPQIRSLIGRVDFHVPSMLLAPQRESIMKYLRDAAHELSAAETLGPQDELVLNRLNTLKDPDLKRALLQEFDLARGKAYDTRYSTVRNVLRVLNNTATTLISLNTTIRHLNRFLVPAMMVGARNMMRGTLEALSVDGRFAASEAGADISSILRTLRQDLDRVPAGKSVWQDWAKGTGEFASRTIQWTGIPVFDRFVRQATFLGARRRIDALLTAARTGNPKAISELGRLGVSLYDEGGQAAEAAAQRIATSEYDRTLAALKMTQDTNPFSWNPYRTPSIMRTPLAMAIMSLRQFDYQYWRMISSYVMEPMSRGDLSTARMAWNMIGRGAKIAGGLALSGEAVNTAFDQLALLAGRGPQSPTGSIQDFANQEEHKASLALALRRFGYDLAIGSVAGIWTELLGLQFGGSLVGAGLSQVPSVAQTGIELGKAATGALSGNRKAERQAAQQGQTAAHRIAQHIPVVGGPISQLVIPSPKLDQERKALEVARAIASGDNRRAGELQRTWKIPRATLRAALKRVHSESRLFGQEF